MRRLRFLWAPGLLAVAWFALAATARGASESPPATVAFDSNDCRACHEPSLKKLDTTPHAGVAGSCSSCHGDVTEHLKSALETGEPGAVPSMKSMKAADVNATCQSCHEATHHPAWKGSAHDRRDVACTSCHSIHDFKSTQSQLKTASEPDTCYQCHKDMRARALRTSHHPVREGLMTCSSCHNPHDGSRPKMIKADWTNELCLQCHAEKRGPFLWEHAPVREDCLNCHNPHGSNHDKLLVAKQPYLCQRCHLNTRHPGTFYDGRNAATLTAATATNRAIEHACKNCHQNIHGGNAPSGPYLGR